MDDKITQFHNHSDIRKSSVNVVIIIAALCMLVIAGCLEEGAKLPALNLFGEKQPLSKDERMKWWRKARFGMFIRKLDTNSFKLLRGFITFAPDL